MAKLLRSSADPVIANKVYINKYMTRSEALSAYEERITRRTKEKQRALSQESAEQPPSMDVQIDIAAPVSAALDILHSSGILPEPNPQPSSTSGSGAAWRATGNGRESLLCALFNAQSLGNKLPDLHHLASTSSYDLILITEFWLSDKISDAMVNPGNNYNLTRYDRKYRSGGGVCVLSSKEVKCTNFTLSKTNQMLLDQSRCELICFDLWFAFSKFRVILLYRPPNTSFEYRNDLLLATKSTIELLYNLVHPKFSTIVVGATLAKLTGTHPPPKLMASMTVLWNVFKILISSICLWTNQVHLEWNWKHSWHNIM